MSQYAYTLNVGDTFTLPGETQQRTVTEKIGRGVHARVTDDTGETHEPDIVVAMTATPHDPITAAPEPTRAQLEAVKHGDSLASFYDAPHEGHYSRIGGTYWCDTCNSPYCELA